MGFGSVAKTWQAAVVGGAVEETRPDVSKQLLRSVRVAGTFDRDETVTLGFDDGSERLVHLCQGSEEAPAPAGESRSTPNLGGHLRISESEQVQRLGRLVGGPARLREVVIPRNAVAEPAAEPRDAASGENGPWPLESSDRLAAPKAGVTWATDSDAAFTRTPGDTAFGLAAYVPAPAPSSQHGLDRASVAAAQQKRSRSLVDSDLVSEAVTAAINKHEELLVAALLPVTEGGHNWHPPARVTEHIPCQKGEAVILAEHRTEKPRPLEVSTARLYSRSADSTGLMGDLLHDCAPAQWIPPDAPPQRHHRLSLPGGRPQAGQLCRLESDRQRAVDEFVLSGRVAAATRGCEVEELATLLTARWGTQPEQVTCCSVSSADDLYLTRGADTCALPMGRASYRV